MNAPLTRAQVKSYLAESHRCPYCKSEDIEGQAGRDHNADSIYQEVACLSCEKEWVDEYRLADVRAKDE